MSPIEIAIMAYVLGPILVAGLLVMPRVSARSARRALYRRRIKAALSADWWNAFEREFRLYASEHSQRETHTRP
jgi:hypothetical protein